MRILQSFDPYVYVSLAFLFGIAAQFRAMDGYSFLRRFLSHLEGRIGILYATATITSLFSPLILNDVVVLILTPVLVSYSKNSKVDITPLIVAEITFTNIASSLTPLGNPQNILLWEASGISFHSFVLGTWMPLALSGAIAATLLFPMRQKKKETGNSKEAQSTFGSSPNPVIYLGAVAAILLASDLFALQAYIALGLGFLLGFLFTFRSFKEIRNGFDIRSLMILCLLIASVTLVAAFIEPSIGKFVSPAAKGVQPYSALLIASLSNLISNVPATQLILKVASVPPYVAPKIAVETGLAGNIDPIASFATILVLLIVKRAGLPMRKAVILQLVIGSISFLPALL